MDYPSRDNLTKIQAKSWTRSRRSPTAQRVASKVPRRGTGCAGASSDLQQVHGSQTPPLPMPERRHHRATKNQQRLTLAHHRRNQLRTPHRTPLKWRDRRWRRRLQPRPLVLPRQSSARNDCAIMSPRLYWPDSIGTLALKVIFLQIASSTTTKAQWIGKGSGTI